MSWSTIAYPEGNKLNDCVPFDLGQLGSSQRFPRERKLERINRTQCICECFGTHRCHWVSRLQLEPTGFTWERMRGIMGRGSNSQQWVMDPNYGSEYSNSEFAKSHSSHLGSEFGNQECLCIEHRRLLSSVECEFSYLLYGRWLWLWQRVHQRTWVQATTLFESLMCN